MDNNDFILKIVAELEQKGIKTGFDKLKKELEKDPAKIDVILDTSGTVGKTKGSIKKLAAELHNELSVEINKLQKQGQDINFDLSVGDVEKVIQNVINHTKKLGESFDVASNKAQKFLAKFNKKSGGVLINSDEFKAVQDAINGLGNTHTIEDLNKAMNTLEVTYDNMSSKLRNSGKSPNPFINAKNEMATMDKTIEGISLEFDKLSSKPDDVANAIKELSVQQNKVNNFAIGTMEWSDAYGHLQKMIRNVTKDISNLQKAQSSKSLQPRIDEIQLSLTDKSEPKDNYNLQIEKQIAQLKSLGLTNDEVAAKTKVLTDAHTELKQVVESTNFNSVSDKNQAILSADEKRTAALRQVKNAYEQAKLSYDKFNQPVSNEKAVSLINRINSFLTKNTRITKSARTELVGYTHELNKGVNLGRWNEISNSLKATENCMRGLNKLGNSFKNQMSQAANSFTQWISISSGIMFLVSNTKNAITEIKDLNNILTEISKTSNMSIQQLKQLGMEAYSSASKYGRTASDYLVGVQEMNRSGFYGEKGTGMAEQSLLAQSSGDMNAELADRYVLATNAAYKLNGEAEKINEVLDGQNFITNTNSVAMKDMAESMTIAGTVASSYRVSIEDLSAMIGTIESVTKLGGSEVGNAIKAILINLQNITSSKIVDTLDKANASMTEMVNGAEKLRNPIAILRDLAKTFNQLDEDDPLRAEILTNIGQKYHANKLGALLQNMSLFDKMLADYSDGEGSALEESNKSAENLTGTINKLKNSWTEFINGVISPDELKNGVNFLNNLVKGLTNITSSGEKLTTTLLTIVGIFAQMKFTSGGLMRLIYLINRSPFLATVEFNSDVYDSYIYL